MKIQQKKNSFCLSTLFRVVLNCLALILLLNLIINASLVECPFLETCFIQNNQIFNDK